MQIRFYTIGHGRKTLSQLVELLKAYNVQALMDIRSYPRSKRNPHFNHETLEAELPNEGIAYLWLKSLGGYRKSGLGAQSPHIALRSQGFRNYADHMLTDAFKQEIERLSQVARRRNSCLMCAETLPFRCHRWLLSDYLVANEIQVVHIMGVKQTKSHELSKHARIQGGEVFYDCKGPEQPPLGC